MRLLIISCLVFFTNLLFAQTDSTNFQKARRHFVPVNEHLKAKNYTGYRDELAKVLEFIPDLPGISYAKAQAEVLAGNVGAARNILNELIAKKLYYNIAADTIFTKSMDVSDLKSRFEANNQPLIKSKIAFTLDEMDLANEGLAYDELTKTFYITSIHKKKIIAVNGRGVRDFSTPADSLDGIYGITIDSKRRNLWVCSIAVPQMEGYDQSMGSRTFLARYDLRTGELVQKIRFNDKDRHQIKDVTVTSAGFVFFTDMAMNTVYQVAGNEALRIEFNQLYGNTLGITSSDDGRYLFIADFVQGIFRHDLQKRRIEQLTPPKGHTLQGIDGLYFSKEKLIAVQNGIRPNRIIRCTLDSKTPTVSKVEILEANHPDYDWPTLGVVVGNDFYYVANSQWNNFGRDGKVVDAARLKKPVVLKLSIR